MRVIKLLGLGLAAALVLAVDVAFLSHEWDDGPTLAGAASAIVATLTGGTEADAAAEIALEVPAGSFAVAFDRLGSARGPARADSSARGQAIEGPVVRAPVEGASLPLSATGPISGSVPMNPHAIAGSLQTCTNCHARGAIAPLPPTHGGQTAETCLSCHVTPVVPPPATPHEANGRWACLSCHVVGKEGALPASHKARREATCLACHPADNAARQGRP